MFQNLSKKIFSFLFFVCFLILINIIFVTEITFAESEIDYSETEIRINEILADPNDGDSEFIEIYNKNEIILIDWYIHYESISGSTKDYKNLNSDKYLKIKFSSLHNSGGTLTLYDNTNKEIFIYSYSNSTKGRSWNYDEKEWYEETPTPNAKNIEKPIPKDYSKTKIRINEILADPNDDETEFIELYNFGDEEIDLTNWILQDKTTNQLKFNNIKIKSEERIAFLKGKNFSFSLNNTDETIYLKDPNGNIFIEKSYSTSTKGLSWNYDKNTWYEATTTPNEKNKENPTTKDYPEIIINEALPNPEGTDTENEFIEIYNPNNTTVNLNGWILHDTSTTKTVLENIEIKPFEYLVFYNKKDFSFTLNNDTDTIYLESPNPKIKTVFTYKNPTEGLSVNFDEKENYSAETTPNAKNAENPLTKNYPDLQLSEILPNPIGDEATDEFIEIYNPNNFEVNLENWILKDSSKTGNYIFKENQKISANSYFTIYRKDFDFALNNSGGETVTLIAPNQKIKSEINYQTARENISYNFDLENNNWRWSKFLTPNAKNKFNNLPEIKNFSIDDESYKNVYTNFKVEAFDVDGEELKIRWDFGDGRKSYKAETKHKYTETGTYYGSLRVQDESEEVVKNFTIEVKKYKKQKVEIIKIVPNPTGTDSGNEYLVIKNNSKEKIDFENWSIATGTTEEKLTNHPIRKSFKLKKDEDKKITREYSAISLPNKKGFIELRQPDGKVVDKVFYEKEKIADDESYEKINEEWQWISRVKSELDNPEVQNIISQALENEEKWQEENFQQKIAGKVIDKNTKNKNESEIKNNFWLDSFSEKLNLFLSKNLPMVNNFLANIFKENYLAWLKNKAIAFVFTENKTFVLTEDYFEFEKLV